MALLNDMQQPRISELSLCGADPVSALTSESYIAQAPASMSIETLLDTIEY